MSAAPDIRIKEDFIKGLPESWRRWRVIVDGRQVAGFKTEAEARSWADELYWKSTRK
jgi:hypothetical protein